MTSPSAIRAWAWKISDTYICQIRRISSESGSAILVSPEIFRRIAVDDCLANDGRALAPGAALSVKYANTKQYPLPVVSATC
ncbi:hypothetical protein NC653_026502 [Populus alba x Populus x berolinensis]|uniref:Uncharacterized protein n=1 Tax=Populus alba x Populus x berolinensis TaxID=444605 RepID=A0AAD6QB84_9ROSI|nr:hypothetical protein NC653_026502 [Populus alba x Populus x berolinensis]